MNKKKSQYLIDWGIIIVFLLLMCCSWIKHDLWEKTTYIAPVFVFFALSILFLNHVSLIHCIIFKDKEFYLMCGGILLGALNMILVKSGIGAIFTLADFFLILYLANKIHFDSLQLGVIAFSCFLIWIFWQFGGYSVIGNSAFNTNGLSLIIFSCFCIVTCYLSYIWSLNSALQKQLYILILIVLLYFLSTKVFFFRSRGVLAAIFTWIITFIFIPKKKFMIVTVLGISLFLPAFYVYLWKSGILSNISILGKHLMSGGDRDIIWYEFFNVFIQHPITGIGSNFEQMLPNLYTKEAHHALLDLLFVHGIPVFCIVLYFFYKRISDIVAVASNTVSTICLASIYGMLAAGTFENYYIVSPYNILLFTIFLIFNAYNICIK